jgi:arsenate reductase
MPFETATLLHNPKCSKSRAAKALLDEKGFAYQERRYLDEPLDANELRVLAERLGRPAREWIRSSEPAFAEAGLTLDAGDDAILAAMARHPILIERPILILPKRAIVGRPPERVLEIAT